MKKYPSPFTDVLRVHKPRKKGVAQIVHDSPSLIDRVRGSISGMPLNQAKYCRLLVRGNTMMTNAEFEQRTNIDAIHSANGHALIAGLGLGLILAGVQQRCKSVTVIEKEADVIALVARKFPRVRVIHADIFEWLPTNGTKFDFIYFDIWPEINPDDLSQARQLHRRFKPYLNDGGFMQSWCRTAYNALRR